MQATVRFLACFRAAQAEYRPAQRPRFTSPNSWFHEIFKKSSLPNCCFQHSSCNYHRPKTEFPNYHSLVGDNQNFSANSFSAHCGIGSRMGEPDVQRVEKSASLSKIQPTSWCTHRQHVNTHTPPHEHTPHTTTHTLHEHTQTTREHTHTQHEHTHTT